MGSFAVVTPVPRVPGLGELTYGIPAKLADEVRTGVRVVMPVGRRKVTGLVLSLAEKAPEGVETRELESVLDPEPVVPEDLIRLFLWMAEYYLAPIADVLSLALGRGLTTSSHRMVRLLDGSLAKGERQTLICEAITAAGGTMDARKLSRQLAPRPIDSVLTTMVRNEVVAISHVLPEPKLKPRFETTAVVARIPGEAERIAMFRRAPRREEIFEHLLEQPTRSARVTDLGQIFSTPSAPLRSLADAGLIRLEKTERYRGSAVAPELAPVPELTEEQQTAVDAVRKRLGSFAPFLLQGVTSSGKTEVYLRLIAQVVEQGKSALLLVPEISLTHQVLARVTARFGSDAAVLHSELSPGERWDAWRRIARGEARVVVGARSAVIGPVADLGLVVVDEEHDSSYKQDDGVRYHARDVAVVRARLSACPVVLGSATPSTETFHNAQEGRYEHLRLTKRVTESPLPRVEVVDLRGRDVIALGGLSEHLAEQTVKNFEAGSQTLLFLNRRGFAPSLQCYECGQAVECEACSVALTVHTTEKRLRCHHCDAHRAIPRQCPGCSRDALVSQGLGTQRLEATVRSLLPKARITRLDRDAAAQRGKTGEILADWRNHKIDVLIGTQMITKGHDVAGVTLVGVVHADAALSVPDFRASEKTFQLLAQVAGRAGRGEKKGRVILQTYQPDHPAIQAAVRHDFERFAEEEMPERAELGYPPYGRMAVIRIEGTNRTLTERMAAQAARLAAEVTEHDESLRVRGPAPAMVERIKGRWRFKVELLSERGAMVRHAAQVAREALRSEAAKAQIRILLDIDPHDTL